MKKIFILLVMVVASFVSSTACAEDFGMYVKVMDSIGGTVETVAKNAESALTRNGWQIIASSDASVPDGCGYRAHVIVIHSPEYAQKITSHGVNSAFALPLRVGIFTNENGINISFVNPASLNRTVLGDDVEAGLSAGKMKELSEILASSGKGRILNQQTGEVRSQGYVGGMGGGKFSDKIEEIYKAEDSGSAFQKITAKVREGISSNTNGWKLVYALESGNNVVIYGVNKAKTEARAYKIAGEKRESKMNPCPGIDHVAAFPAEVIVQRDKGTVKVVTLDEMYRMKIYFEDAGKWAFMKNMGMPGEIEKEIIEMSSSKLK